MPIKSSGNTRMTVEERARLEPEPTASDSKSRFSRLLRAGIRPATMVVLALVVWSLLKMFEARNPPPVTEGGVESGVVDSMLGAPALAPNAE